MTKWECFRGSNFQKGLINHSLKEGKKKKKQLSACCVSFLKKMQRGKGCRCPILLHPEPAVTRRGRSQPCPHLCGLQEWVCNKQLGAPILPAEPGFDPTSPGCVSPLQLQAQKAGKKNLHITDSGKPLCPPDILAIILSSKLHWVFGAERGKERTGALRKAYSVRLSLGHCVQIEKQGSDDFYY